MAFASVQSDPVPATGGDDGRRRDDIESRLLSEAAADTAADATAASTSEGITSDSAESDQEYIEQLHPATTGPDLEERGGVFATGIPTGQASSVTAEDDILDDALSEQSDDCDLFAAAVDRTKGFTTYEDRALERTDALANLLRDRPLLPVSSADASAPDTDVNSGRKWPLVHCGFKGCTRFRHRRERPSLEPLGHGMVLVSASHS